MKKILLGLIVLFLGTTLFSACSDWNEPEAKTFPFKNTDEYYENLRAYKKSDHAIVYGWYGGWTGKGASLVNCLDGLPDSVDVVSIWGNWRNLTEAQQADMKRVQTLKGTKVLICFIVDNIGAQLTPEGTDAREYWGWYKDKEVATRAYANAIADTINKYGYDGFDFDYEPNRGHSGDLSSPNPSAQQYSKIFIEELGKRIGPQSGTDKLFLVDGDPILLPVGTLKYFNYFVPQTYNSASDTQMDGWYNGMKSSAKGASFEEFNSKKFIGAINYEEEAATGGRDYTDRKGNKMQSVKGISRWNPSDGRKGGIALYHIEYDYDKSPEYKYVREAIQQMNPAVK